MVLILSKNKIWLLTPSNFHEILKNNTWYVDQAINKFPRILHIKSLLCSKCIESFHIWEIFKTRKIYWKRFCLLPYSILFLSLTSVSYFYRLVHTILVLFTKSFIRLKRERSRYYKVKYYYRKLFLCAN